MITLIIGPMFSEKTTELIRLLNREKFAKKKVVLVRPETDTRDYLTHSGLNPDIKQVYVNELSDLADRTDYDVIGIDEGQFFKRISHDANFLANNGKLVIISALNGTSEQQPFESIQDLIPLSEVIIKQNAVCMECGSQYATFSYFKSGIKKDKIRAGGKTDYEALCRKCYFTKTGVLNG